MTSIIKVNNLQNQCGANTINKCGTAITVGASGDTVTLAAGASQSGFGQTYSAVSWDTTPKTGLFTAVSGVGYFCNTTSAPFTVTLPAGTAGDIVAFADYAATWQTSNVTVTPNGTEKIGSLNENATLNVEGQSVTFVFVDSTQGWINTMDSTSNVRGNPPFVTATVSGACNTLVTSGDYKIATFLGPGTFCVSAAGAPAGSDTVDYLVVAGGGGGGGTPSASDSGAGGGGGGFRESVPSPAAWTASPLAASGGALPVSVQGYAVVVGASGAGGPAGTSGNNGSNSTFSTIISTGGGGGSGTSGPLVGNSGGSGGGAQGCSAAGGAGNTPPVSPSQGQPGAPGAGTANYYGNGGGGATAVGSSANCGGAVSNGGAGAGTEINPSPTIGTPGPVGPQRYFAGGAGGGAVPARPACFSQPAGVGGVGGGGGGGGTSGTTNTGGGGGGKTGPGTGGAGGSGIVIIRYKFQ